MHGEPDPERASWSWIAVQINSPPVRSDAPLRDGQSQARSALCACARLVDPIETFKDPFPVLKRYSFAAITDFNDGMSVGHFHSGTNATLWRRIFDGIVNYC